ncbi:hypothetical protein CB1_001533047 [Camelus ferus]|nr:hypothetical protein CB1_001533047 [Camelus ferus]
MFSRASLVRASNTSSGNKVSSHKMIDVLALPIFKQEEPQLSPENEARLPPLQYVLCAATSPAVKLHEETLTYLNQGSGRSSGPGRGLGGHQEELSTWGMRGQLPSVELHLAVMVGQSCRSLRAGSTRMRREPSVAMGTHLHSVS